MSNMLFDMFKDTLNIKYTLDLSRRDLDILCNTKACHKGNSEKHTL